jgi:transcriptional regulator with XRE-family HTH domain
MQALGEPVKRLREAEGWTQRDLAAKAFFTEAHVAMLETGAKRASAIVLRRFERALGVRYGALEALGNAATGPHADSSPGRTSQP